MDAASSQGAGLFDRSPAASSSAGGTGVPRRWPAEMLPLMLPTSEVVREWSGSWCVLEISCDMAEPQSRGRAAPRFSRHGMGVGEGDLGLVDCPQGLASSRSPCGASSAGSVVERSVLWWNFVGRMDEEIRQAREGWMSGDRFGEVKGATTATGSMPRRATDPAKGAGQGAVTWGSSLSSRCSVGASWPLPVALVVAGGGAYRGPSASRDRRALPGCARVRAGLVS